MSSSHDKAVSFGTCKECGKALEYTPIPSIGKEFTYGCISNAQTRARELQQSVAHNSNYCSDCILKVRSSKIKKILAVPISIYKKLIES